MAGRSSEELVLELADLEQIRDLARRYAHYVWQRDARGAADLFVENCTMDTGDRPPIEGRALLFETYDATFHESTFKPFIHNHVVDFDEDRDDRDRASGTVYLDLRATAEGTPMTGYGHYLDRYVRTADGWKFESRKLNLEEYVER